MTSGTGQGDSMDLDLLDKRVVLDGQFTLIPRRQLRTRLRGCGARVPRSSRAILRLIQRDRVDALIIGNNPLLIKHIRGPVQVWDEVSAATAVGLLDDPSVRLTRLRDLLHQPPAPQVWSQVCTCLEFWPEDEALDLGLDYAEHHLRGWPDALREAPRRWFERVCSGGREPRLALARAARFTGPGVNPVLMRGIVSAHDASNLTQLAFDRCALTQPALVALGKHMALPKLTRLEITNQPFDHHREAALAEAPALARLRTLTLPVYYPLNNTLPCDTSSNLKGASIQRRPWTR